MRKRTIDWKMGKEALLNHVTNSVNISNKQINGYHNDINGDKGELDDFISALTSGVVFGEGLFRYRRRRRRVNGYPYRISQTSSNYLREDYRERSLTRK